MAKLQGSFRHWEGGELFAGTFGHELQALTGLGQAPCPPPPSEARGRKDPPRVLPFQAYSSCSSREMSPALPLRCQARGQRGVLQEGQGSSQHGFT